MRGGQNLIDRTGHRYGRLLVLERARSRNGLAMWRCRCDCGVEKTVDSSSLRMARTVSCGCYWREVLLRRRIDITGQRFGRLLVVKPAFYDKSTHQLRWECICDCGYRLSIIGKNLRSGKSRSCGCNRGRPNKDARVASVPVGVEQAKAVA